MAQAGSGGWLAEHQRRHCSAASPLSTYQGLIADQIVLPQSAVDARDPVATVLACSGFCEAVQSQCFLIAGEYAPEALWSYYTHQYLLQAKAGGHAQYFANHGRDAIALQACASALKSMLADPHADLFNLMVRLRRSRPTAARKLARQAGSRDVASALREIDRSFAELEKAEPLTPRHKNWLKSLRKVKVVPDAEIAAELAAIAAANPLLRARREESDRIRAEHERTDPAFRAARALCEMAGLRFAGMRALGFAPMRSVWPEGPERRAFGYRVETNRGPRAALFYVEGRIAKKRLAVLIEQANPLPVGSLSLSPEEYVSIVPSRPRPA